METTNIEVTYQDTPMLVFQQLRIGRFRLYHAAAREALGTIQEMWKRGTLGKTFLIRPMPGQFLGEEIVDGTGRIVAVFGLALTDAFRPDSRERCHYQTTLRALLDQL